VTGPAHSTALLDDLNAEQRRAVEAVTGPVVILAGAGSGKTTTITRRIALQVSTGAFAARSILAVTFTTKAAAELVQRLEQLGVVGVQARTFHSAALRQLQRLAHRDVDVLESKIPILLSVRERLPKPFHDQAAGDLASEIERAKNNRLTPSTYLDSKRDAASPLPPELMQRAFAEYEEQKRGRGKLDYEDLLEQAIQLFERDPSAVARFRAACRAITVDEFQDVNLLQQTLLELWLGDRDEICLVGDDYQAIFGFTGASPKYLIGMRDRFAHATVVTLETNYRSSPQILGLANRLVPHLAGVPKTLRAHHGDGPAPSTSRYQDASDEAAEITRSIQTLIRDGIEPSEIAILYRINARSARYESELHRAGIPYQVAKGGFLERPAAKSMLRKLSRSAGRTDVAATVLRLAEEAGYTPGADEAEVGPQEYTRQLDLALLTDLARDFDADGRTIADFTAYLHDRFGSYEDSSTRQAVRLSTLHLAKGLEWDAVFLPSVNERELPYWRAIESGTVAEERRLFYVGVTRARRHLFISHTSAQAPSSFISEIDLKPVREPKENRRPSRSSQTWTLRRDLSKPRPNRKPPFEPLSDTEAEQLLASLPSAWKTGSGNGNPPSQIRNHRSSQPWTDKEDRLLAHFVQKGQWDQEIAESLGRRPEAITARRAKLHL